MARLPRVTVRQLIRALQHAGSYEDRQTGGHRQFCHPERAGTVTVKFHAGETLPPRYLTGVLRQANMTPDEFRRLL